MKSRWIVNLVLLVLVLGISAFLYLKPKQEVATATQYEISTRKLAEFDHISVEYPTKSPVRYEKKDGYWYMTEPHKQRADQISTQRILSILAAKSNEKFPANDLSRFGLDNPRLKLKLNDQEFLFGTHNPVTTEQYVLHNNAVYLLESSYEEAATIQVLEMIDKRMLTAKQKIASFDLSKLEQWEATGLTLSLDKGEWKVSIPNAKPNQNELKEWLSATWGDTTALSVETYTPDRKASYPYFVVTLQDGSKLHFDKLQESPELLLARPDEGLIYHFPSDMGFSMLNPPVGLSK